MNRLSQSCRIKGCTFSYAVRKWKWSTFMIQSIFPVRKIKTDSLEKYMVQRKKKLN